MNVGSGHCTLKINNPVTLGAFSTGTNISIFLILSWAVEEIWSRLVGWIGSRIIAMVASGK